MQNYEFIDKDGSFRLKGAENDRELYFPIAGEHGLKSAITPNLCGDAKLDQNHFLLEPQSVGSGTKADLAEFLVYDKGAGGLVCNRYVG